MGDEVEIYTYLWSQHQEDAYRVGKSLWRDGQRRT